MADFMIFHYRPGNTIFHNLDPRIKILSMLSCATVVLFSSIYGLMFMLVSVILSLAYLREPIPTIIKNGIIIWILAAILFFSKCFTVEGKIIFTVPVIGHISKEGLFYGFIEAGRLIFMVFLAHFFMAVTSSSEIENGAASLLRFLPRETGEKTAFLFSLSMNFIPKLFDVSEDIHNALVSRGFNFKRRLIKRIVIFAETFFHKIFQSVKEIDEAIISRGYNFNRKRKQLKFSSKDIIAVFGLLIFFAVASYI